MTEKQPIENVYRTCPRCGVRLEPEGTTLRCEIHGLFFSYGPRLLVQVAHPDAPEAVLLPWQNLNETTPA